MIASVTEGDDKPLKYPHMFRGSQLLLLNKIDLLPYVPFDVERCLDYARQVNPAIRVLEVSASAATAWPAGTTGSASRWRATEHNVVDVSGVTDISAASLIMGSW